MKLQNNVVQNNKYTIVECPRDAMQGWSSFIPTHQKINYLNALLQVGFDVLDFGSFVSPKAIPQMADTKEVLAALDLSKTKTKLLAIVANERGANDAMQFEEISYLGFPFSISPTFQLRNTNSSIEQSIETVKAIQELCVIHNKKLVIYLSMAFGNPYGDKFDIYLLEKYTKIIQGIGVTTISLADTVGVATPKQIAEALNLLTPKYKEVDFGVHLHTSDLNWQLKLQAAVDAGCTRFDGALMGIGGCPMADDNLIGNLDTINILQLLQQNNLHYNYSESALQNSLQLAKTIFTA